MHFSPRNDIVTFMNVWEPQNAIYVMEEETQKCLGLGTLCLCVGSLGNIELRLIPHQSAVLYAVGFLWVLPI